MGEVGQRLFGLRLPIAIHGIPTILFYAKMSSDAPEIWGLLVCKRPSSRGNGEICHDPECESPEYERVRVPGVLDEETGGR